MPGDGRKTARHRCRPPNRAAVLRDQPGLDAGAATRLLVNRLLQAPSEVLRGLAASVGERSDAEGLARPLFRLERDEGEEDP